MLWLWHRLAATALIGPLAWESPYDTGVALEKTKRQKNKKKQKKKTTQTYNEVPSHRRQNAIIKKSTSGVLHHGSVVTNPTSSHEDSDSIPGLV